MRTRFNLPVAKSSSGSNELLAATGGIIFRVIGYSLSAAGAVTFKFQSASTDLTGAKTLATGVPDAFIAPLRCQTDETCICQTAVGEALNLTLGGAVAVGGFVIYERVVA